MPSDGGSRLVRACEKRFITHKASARKRIIDRFGAYFSHLISMTEDVKSTDKQKMKGYTCSVVPSFMTYFNHQCSKVLQEDQVCVVRKIAHRSSGMYKC